MSEGDVLDWRNDPRLKDRRRDLARLYAEHKKATEAKDIERCGKLVTEIQVLLSELGIERPSQIGL